MSTFAQSEQQNTAIRTDNDPVSVHTDVSWTPLTFFELRRRSQSGFEALSADLLSRLALFLIRICRV